MDSEEIGSKTIMKKWLLIIAWISGTLCACRKDSPSPESAGIRLCLDASLPPVTKLQWAGGDENGYKVSFDAHDRILAYFRNAAGNQVGNEIVLPVDPASLSADGRRAAFSAGEISVPDGSTEIFTYLDSDAEPDYMTYGATPFVELAAQSGSLQEAMGRQIIAGSVPLEALEGSAGNLAGTVAFSYRTSLLKLELSFPEGSVPPVGTAITLKNEGKTFYNRVRLTWGVPFRIANRNTKGPIATVAGTPEGNTLHNWLCIWAGDDFTGSIIEVKDGETTWSATFDPKEAPQAGKLYRVRRTLSAWEPETGGGGITGGGYTEK